MACTALMEKEDDCLNNIGGSTQFIYNDQAEVDSETVVIDPLTGIITAMTAASAFKSVFFKKNAGSYVESEKIDIDAGSNYIEGTVTLSLKRRDASKSMLIRAAAEGQRMMAILQKDGNGLWWYFKNMQLTANEGGSGANKAEGSKYDLTFMGEYEVLAYQVEESVIAGLLTPIP